MLAVLVVLLGFGAVALGLVEPEMYVVGLTLVGVGSIGVAVRSWDLGRWLWQHRP